MNRRLIVALSTAVVFMAGYATGVWHENTRPLPPPPSAVGAEFGHTKLSYSFSSPRDRAINRKELVTRIEALKPQLEAFRKEVISIDKAFEADFKKILSAEQLTRYEDHLKRREASRGKGAKHDAPMSDAEIENLMWDQPARSLISEMVLPLRLDILSREYKLDDQQKITVNDLLKIRRTKVLALIDSSPPPSVQLMRLAPYIQRLVKPVPYAEASVAK
jgi:hypothetical protein